VDEAAGRAVRAAGQLRVAVWLDDLEALPEGTPERVVGTPGDTPSGGPRAGRRGVFSEAAGSPPAAPARRGSAAPATVASTLDLRGARVDEALEALERYLDRAAVAGAGRVTIVHGHGSGALRDAVRATLGGHPLVREWRPGGRGEGGDGASVVDL
ncbi:MAG: Smr/MutS family protein, partial [Candidatus Limnocylindrales bacterium]